MKDQDDGENIKGKVKLFLYMLVENKMPLIAMENLLDEYKFRIISRDLLKNNLSKSFLKSISEKCVTIESYCDGG